MPAWTKVTPRLCPRPTLLQSYLHPGQIVLPPMAHLSAITTIGLATLQPMAPTLLKSLVPHLSQDLQWYGLQPFCTPTTASLGQAMQGLDLATRHLMAPTFLQSCLHPEQIFHRPMLHFAAITTISLATLHLMAPTLLNSLVPHL